MTALYGWIKLHRQIMEHWVYENDSYFKAWTTIIMVCNHEPKKVLIDGELFDCDRGQSLRSLEKWSKIFGTNWSIQKVRTFFKLLENDKMIITEGLRKTTRLTICNYSEYQNEQQADNKQITSSQQASNKEITTNKNDKNDKNEEKYIPEQLTLFDCEDGLEKPEKEKPEYSEMFEKFWIAYGKKGNKKKAYKQFSKLKDGEVLEIRQKIGAYLESTPDIKYRKNAEVYLNPANKHWNDIVVRNNEWGY